jgi:hypothetical protein
VERVLVVHQGLQKIMGILDAMPTTGVNDEDSDPEIEKKLMQLYADVEQLKSFNSRNGIPGEPPDPPGWEGGFAPNH